MTQDEYKELEPELLKVINQIIGKFVAQARAEAIEDAARVCRRLIEATNETNLNDYQKGFLDGIDCCENNIRALPGVQG